MRCGPSHGRQAALGTPVTHTQRSLQHLSRTRHAPRASKQPSSGGSEDVQLESDPEASLRQYGKWFGKAFKLPAWIDEAPRVRVRTIAKRQMDDLVELAVLNERLTGTHDPWDVRNRLELLRTRRKNWEHIYNYVTKQEAAATLDLIEEANQQVLLQRPASCKHTALACRTTARCNSSSAHMTGSPAVLLQLRACAALPFSAPAGHSAS